MTQIQAAQNLELPDHFETSSVIITTQNLEQALSHQDIVGFETPELPDMLLRAWVGASKMIKDPYSRQHPENPQFGLTLYTQILPFADQPFFTALRLKRAKIADDVLRRDPRYPQYEHRAILGQGRSHKFDLKSCFARLYEVERPLIRYAVSANYVITSPENHYTQAERIAERLGLVPPSGI